MAEKNNYKRLEEKVLGIKKKTICFDFGSRVKLGVISDTHLGNINDHHELLGPIYDLFKKEKCEIVLHAGDFVDGDKMYRGQEFELYAHGLEQQRDLAIKLIPNNLNTYFITGSHDLSFWRQVGIDIGNDLEKRAKHLHYLGQEEADVKFGETIIRLFHPGKGTAYALSYQPQKYIESLSGGMKPNILIIGHYHKAEFIPCYRNVFTIQAGCIQGQTPFMRRGNIAAHVGCWIIDFSLDKKGISRMKAEFFPYYENGKIKEVVRSLI